MTDFVVEAAAGPLDEIEAEARALRLVLAALDDDMAQLKAVAADFYEDRQEFELATWQMIVTLSAALAREWAGRADVPTVKAGIRAALAGRYEADHD
jgi:hypothetical protein